MSWGEKFGGTPVAQSSNWGEKFGGIPITQGTPKKVPFDMWGIVKDSAKDALRKTAQIPRNVVAGAGDIADLPIMGINYALRSTGVKKQIPHVGQGLAEGIDALTGGYTKPTTDDERTTETVTRAISSIPAGALAGAKLVATGIKGVAKLGRGLQKINPIEGTNIVGTGAGALAGHAYNESNPEDFVGTLGTGLAADMATRAAMGLGSKKNWAKALKINPEAVESFQSMGLSPTLGQASDNAIIKTGENIIKGTSISNKLRDTTSDQYKHMFDVLGPGAANKAYTEKQTGHAIQESLVNYGKKASKTTEKLKKKWTDKVEKSPVGADLDVTDSLHFYEKLEDSFKTKTMKKRLQESPVGQQYKDLKEIANSNHGRAPVQDMDQFRRDLRDLSESLVDGSDSKRLVDELRGKVTEDVKDFMSGIGALRDWNKYNSFYRRWAENRKKHIVTAKGKIDANVHELFDDIVSKKELNRHLLESVYESQKINVQKETMDSIIQKMGKSGNNVDAHLFAKRFSNQPKETQDLLLKPLSSPMRDKFKGVIRSIDIIKELNAFGNPSRTATTQAVYEGSKLGLLTLANMATGHGISDAMWQYALLQGSTDAISRGMFTNPKFINWAYKGSKMKPQARAHHIAGIKGILGRPVYQEIKNALSGQNHEKD